MLIILNKGNTFNNASGLTTPTATTLKRLSFSIVWGTEKITLVFGLS